MTELKRRKHHLTEKMKILSAKALAQKVGYLRIEDLPLNFDSLPRLTFNPGRSIKSKDNLYVVRSGVVIIKHARHGYFVKDLPAGFVFGNLPLLGQTMAATEAHAGNNGATLGVLDAHAAKQLIQEKPMTIANLLGPRLSWLEVEHYRSRFQLSDSKLAALLLELSENNALEGLSHAELGELVGMYRETVTNTLSIMEADKIIEVSRRKITILDKRALQELSEL